MLQKLATDGHDHVSEQRFFRCELLAKRGLDGWRSIATWAGILYQLSSNFGSSLILPLFWWGVGVVGFAWFTLTEHLIRGHDTATMDAPWLEVAHRATGTSPEGFTCVTGGDAIEPFAAALGLSLRKSLFAGFGPARVMDQIHACLFGTHPEAAFGAFQPIFPALVSWIGVVQFVYSAAMLFLLGLALRNHFKIG